MADSPLPSNVTPNQSGAVPQSPEAAWGAASNQAAPETPATPATPPAEAPVQTTVGGGNTGGKRSIGKIFLVILVFMVLFAVGFAGAVGVSMLLNRDNQAADENSAQTETPSPTPDPTADWETYNHDYYEIKYPDTYVNKFFDARTGEFVDVTSQSTRIGIYESENDQFNNFLEINLVQPKTQTLAEFSQQLFDKNSGDELSEITTPLEELTFEGASALKFTVQGTVLTTENWGGMVTNGTYSVMIVEKSGYFLAFYYSDNDVFNQILSTFKFVEAPANETSEATAAGTLSPTPEAEL